MDCAVQIIPVSFPFESKAPSSLKLAEFNLFQAFFFLFVVANFDLPVCRVALKFSLDESFLTDSKLFGCLCIHMSSVGVKVSEVNADRRSKYIARALDFRRNVPNLKVQILFQIFMNTLYSGLVFTAD